MEIQQERMKPLPQCDHCGMHMSEAQLIKHRRKARCEKVTEMQLRRRYIKIVDRCRDMEFIFYGR